MPEKRGLFIVFEGIDGSGKSAQAFGLVKLISQMDKHNHILLTREPYRTREIRKILMLDENPEEKSEKLAELFVNDRKEHILELIIPNLEKGVFVVSDRYKYSTICYQAAQGLDISKLIEMHLGFLIPDIIFIIDVPVEIAMERMKKDNIRKSEQKFEKNVQFMEKVRQNYLSMKNLLQEEKIIFIDGSKSIEEVFEEVKSKFLALFPHCEKLSS